MMKREHTKGFLSGVIVSILFFCLTGGAAATIGSRMLNVDYHDIKIELNGQLITPTDVNGTVVEPFAVNGTTYLPVRAVSSALGLSVDWDQATSTVKLSGSVSNPGFNECYPDFSVPTLDNVVGLNAYVGLNTVEEHDGVVYFYDASKFLLPAEADFISQYQELLQSYELTYIGSDETASYYRNSRSQTNVSLFWDEDTGYFCVLVMNVPA